MAALETLTSVAIALSAGALIGFEREQSQDDDAPGEALGGARTFPLIVMLGALSVILYDVLGVAAPVVMFLGVLALIAVSYAFDVKGGAGHGMTTEIAVLVTFALGQLSAASRFIPDMGDRALVVAALGVVVTFLLSAKPKLRPFIDKVSKEDFFATLKFLIIAVVVLPLLPKEAMGPFDAIKPFNAGLMVVLIASIGFVGYVASRMLGGGRGLVVTAIAGGLASSTAVTISFSGRAKQHPAMTAAAATAIVLANSIMVGRVVVEAAVVHAPLVRPLLVPLGAMVLVGLVLAAIQYRGAKGEVAAGSSVPVGNPFELSTALRFGLLYMVIVVISRAAQAYAGSAGMYAAAALAGTTDVDAITLSTAAMAREGLEPTVATTTILIAVLSNTLVKAGMAATIGGAALGRRVGLIAVVVTTAGLLGVALVRGMAS